MTDATLANWLKRIDEAGPEALVQLPEPVNKFPAFVSQVVKQLKCVCPTMGKVRIAQLLARAGLKLSPASVRRFVRQGGGPGREPKASDRVGEAASKDQINDRQTANRSVVAKRPHHVWHVDLTIMPTHVGLWVPWVPFCWLQCWPFAYCVVVAVDHFSRKAIASATFKNWPSSDDITRWLDVIMQSVGQYPKYIITDQGPQFGENYREWCQSCGVKPRFGAVGQHGSIAIVERFILSLKNECTRRIIVPLRLDAFKSELMRYFRWYDEVRPHQSLSGRTPNEVYAGTDRRVRPFEVRPVLAKCNTQRNKGRSGAVQARDLRLVIDYQDGSRHLPIISFKRAA